MPEPLNPANASARTAAIAPTPTATAPGMIPPSALPLPPQAPWPPFARRRTARRWRDLAGRLARHARCRCYSMSRLLGGRIWKTLAQPIHDVLQRGAGGEDLLHPALLEGGDVVVRDDAAAEDDDVRRLPPLQLLDHRREERHVRTRMDRKADHLGVLLERRIDHHLRSLAEPGVDHFVTRVAQGSGDYLHASVMAVQPNLGDHDSDWAYGGRRHQTTAVSVYVPKTSIMACMISPSVAYARTASRM